ncbi:MAG: hypothetical protein QXD04_03340 [Candidatus Bathyarchaeia archaeon]
MGKEALDDTIVSSYNGVDEVTAEALELESDYRLALFYAEELLNGRIGSLSRSVKRRLADARVIVWDGRNGYRLNPEWRKLLEERNGE